MASRAVTGRLGAGLLSLHQRHARRFSAIRFESSSHPGPMVAIKHRVHILRHPASHFLRRKIEEICSRSHRRKEADRQFHNFAIQRFNPLASLHCAYLAPSCGVAVRWSGKQPFTSLPLLPESARNHRQLPEAKTKFPLTRFEQLELDGQTRAFEWHRCRRRRRE